MTWLILWLIATVGSFHRGTVADCEWLKWWYRESNHSITFCKGAGIDTAVHELGHHLWYYYLTDAERSGYTEVRKTNYYFVSSYASYNEREDFAEMFMHLMLKRAKMTETQLSQPKSMYVLGLIEKYEAEME